MNHGENGKNHGEFYGGAFGRLCGIVERLRGEGGCPWDREQSPRTLRGDLAEETWECIEAIDEGDPAHIREELGDLYLLVTMIAYMHQEAGAFSISEVLDGIAQKLIRRHPHVFGEGEAGPLSSAEVLSNWERIKVEREGRRPKNSILDGVSRSLPPLDRAWKLQKKAARAGFDWPDAAGALAKVREELEEAAALIPRDPRSRPPQSPVGSAPPSGGAEGKALEGELGDLLFSVVNLCRFAGVEPSLALRRTNDKFTRRFGFVEQAMKERGEAMTAENLSIMDRYWNEAKAIEGAPGA
ncbi:MAG: nucleoside triphosphate pyrophosphohydrolase [Treponema sp.]|jgi:tetrapyrrole methylase family protein/MazG family protein|nr:nucleoside triphosphate pyrophosphohydrolase [Treponema sp.]